jgi:hypothetical protein
MRSPTPLTAHQPVVGQGLLFIEASRSRYMIVKETFFTHGSGTQLMHPPSLVQSAVVEPYRLTAGYVTWRWEERKPWKPSKAFFRLK